MSLGKQIKQAEEKIKALQATISDFEQQLATAGNERALAQETVEKITKENTSARAALEQEIAGLKAAHIEELKKAGEEQSRIAGELKKAQDELAQAKSLLANPAFADANALGEAVPVADGGEAAQGKPESVWDQYGKISDPMAKSKFWNEHEAELKAESKKMFGINK